VLPGKEHIFSEVFTKNLSDHSINTYRLLSRNVGKMFEAVLSNAESASLDSIIPVSQTTHAKTILTLSPVIQLRN
jgi:hypothetical protein